MRRSGRTRAAGSDPGPAQHDDRDAAADCVDGGPIRLGHRARARSLRQSRHAPRCAGPPRSGERDGGRRRGAGTAHRAARGRWQATPVPPAGSGGIRRAVQDVRPSGPVGDAAGQPAAGNRRRQRRRRHRRPGQCRRRTAGTPAVETAFSFYIDRYVAAGVERDMLPIPGEVLGGFAALLAEPSRPAELDVCGRIRRSRHRTRSIPSFGRARRAGRAGAVAHTTGPVAGRPPRSHRRRRDRNPRGNWM